jgi:hypothetical protein
MDRECQKNTNKTVKENTYHRKNEASLTLFHQHSKIKKTYLASLKNIPDISQ